MEYIHKSQDILSAVSQSVCNFKSWMVIQQLFTPEPPPPPPSSLGMFSSEYLLFLSILSCALVLTAGLVYVFLQKTEFFFPSKVGSIQPDSTCVVRENNLVNQVDANDICMQRVNDCAENEVKDVVPSCFEGIHKEIEDVNDVLNRISLDTK